MGAFKGRGGLRLLLFWPLVALLAGALGWALLLSGLDKERRAAETTALQEAAILARGYATHLYNTLTAIDQITLYVKHGWESSGGNLKLEVVARKGLFPFTSGYLVAIADRSGEVVTSTVMFDSERMVNVADQPYFIVQRHLDDFFIDTLRLGKIIEDPVVTFSRRLVDASGDFDGIVLVSVLPEYFTSRYDEVTLGKYGFLGILGADYQVRVTRIGRRQFDAGPQALVSPPFFNRQAGSALLPGKEWFIDQRSRYVGWQPTEAYDMIAVAGLDQESALAPYRAKRESAIRNGILVSFFLAVFTLAAMFFSMRLAWRKHQFETMQATYRTATEGGSEGFFIASPLFDPQGRPCDFTVTDCNQRGAEVLRYRRDELIGRNITSLFHGEPAKRTLQMLCKAWKSGVYEGETNMADLGLEGPQWIHLRISRPQMDLAITMRDISDTKAHVAELEKRGNEDALTGLPNRHWVNAYLPQAIEHAAAERQQLALLFIDLDGFKAVNDTAGHEAGDEILRNVGRRLKEAIRPHDHVVRIGGDEFLVILENMGDKDDAAHVASRVLEAFGASFRISQGIFHLGTSIGISIFPGDGANADTLLKNADIAMYSVKTSGKRNYRFFDQSFYEAVRARHQREAELQRALECDQFIMYYQPRVDVASGKVSSLEALVRWAHPTRGIIEPNEFIPLAEETGLIAGIGEQVVDKVCAQLAAWTRQQREPIPVSINVSPRQFNETDIAELLYRTIARHRIDPRLVEIELTESSMSSDNREVSRALTAIQKLGIKLLVDDFGTGYSSLSQLQRLDFDLLKVDRAFIGDLGKTREGPVFYTAIITMAHALGMRVVAEGVETMEQVQTLRALQCDEIQGFIIARPLPPSEARQIRTGDLFPSTA